MSGGGRPRRPGPRDGDALAGYFGLRWADPGTVALTVRPELINNAGLLTGPAVFALVDYAMASLVYEATDASEFMATVNISINYVGTARSGDATCRARLERRTRTTATLGADVRHEERLLATAIGTFAIFPATVLDRRPSV